MVVLTALVLGKFSKVTEVIPASRRCSSVQAGLGNLQLGFLKEPRQPSAQIKLEFNELWVLNTPRPLKMPQIT